MALFKRKPLYFYKRGYTAPLGATKHSRAVWEVWRRETVFRAAEHLETFTHKKNAIAAVALLERERGR